IQAPATPTTITTDSRSTRHRTAELDVLVDHVASDANDPSGPSTEIAGQPPATQKLRNGPPTPPPPRTTSTAKPQTTQLHSPSFAAGQTVASLLRALWHRAPVAQRPATLRKDPPAPLPLRTTSATVASPAPAPVVPAIPPRTSPLPLRTTSTAVTSPTPAPAAPPIPPRTSSITIGTPPTLPAPVLPPRRSSHSPECSILPKLWFKAYRAARAARENAKAQPTPAPLRAGTKETSPKAGINNQPRVERPTTQIRKDPPTPPPPRTTSAASVAPAAPPTTSAASVAPAAPPTHHPAALLPQRISSDPLPDNFLPKPGCGEFRAARTAGVVAKTEPAPGAVIRETENPRQDQSLTNISVFGEMRVWLGSRRVSAERVEM
ncbi:hypothetical protein HDU96_004244, partial [Phlyctochytrium bullatum]